MTSARCFKNCPFRTTQNFRDHSVPERQRYPLNPVDFTPFTSTNILKLFLQLFYKLFVFKYFLHILARDFLAGMLLADAANCRCQVS